MSMYDNFAKDVSEELFNSIYTDLYSMAEKQQKSLYDASKSKKKGAPGYFIGEHQEMLNDRCKGKGKVGQPVEYIKI